MSARVTVAAIQSAFSDDRERNVAVMSDRIREAAARGADIVLCPELFEGHYFCRSQDEANFERAAPLAGHPTLAVFQDLARELDVVLPVSFFERGRRACYNSMALIDAGGALLGVYRKSHIPDGPGYQEKFYFRPGDTGFRAWTTRKGTIGVGICWDQWFPEAARAMCLLGADILFYPTAIGAEPHMLEVDTRDPWQRVMVGHAVANSAVIVSANRTGQEEEMRFYGSSFIADHRGDKARRDGARRPGCHHRRARSRCAAPLPRRLGIFPRSPSRPLQIPLRRRPIMTKSLVTTSREGGVAILELNNPPANAYSYEMFRELDAAILEARMDRGVHVIVLRGAGDKFFCAGADIGMLRDADPDFNYYFCLHANETLLRLEQTPKLVIAAISGHCVGGGFEIAMAADLRIARAGSGKIGLPEVALGVLPGTGGTQRLTRLLGKSKALELMISGETMTVDAAHALGLVHRVLPAEDYWSELMAVAASYCPPHKAARAVGHIKRAVHGGGDLPLESGLALERELQQRLFVSADAKEGIAAFGDKRKAEFSGE